MYKYTRQDTNKAFYVPIDWCDVTLEKYIGFYKIIKDVEPEELSEKLFNDMSLFHSIISYWVGFDSAKISYTDKIDIFNKISFLFTQIEYTKMDGFAHNGIVYHLPESKKDYYGNSLPLAKATFSEIVECFELEKATTFINALPYILGILCKPHGEKYNDQKVSDRAEDFKTLPMNLVWHTCFFLTNSKRLFNQIIKQSLEVQAREAALIDMAGIMHL